MPSNPHSPSQSPPIVIAIDGPSGAGKSTVARALAREMGFVHLDTGAMFRAVTVFLLERGVLDAVADGSVGPGCGRDPLALDRAVASALVSMPLDLDAGGVVRLEGRPLGERLRAPRVDAAVSAVSALPSVRTRLRELQRAFGTRGALVCEGRDMGTVVFPDAAFKFYLDASVDERARRRAQDFTAAGRSSPLEEVRAAMIERDSKDSGRALAPLVAAADAIRIDTTGLGIDQVVTRLAGIVRAGVDRKEART